MTGPAPASLEAPSTDQPCECLPGRIWYTFLAAQVWVLAALTLAWLVQTVQTAAPPAATWKSFLALLLVEFYTFGLRALRRLDPQANSSWRAFDIAALADGLFFTATFAFRGNLLTGGLFILLYIAAEGLILWRLNLVPTFLSTKVAGLLPRIFPHRQAESLASLEAATLEPAEPSNFPQLADSAAAPDDAEISQQLTYRQTDAGPEITGFIRGRFPSGEPNAAVDIAFCPIFAATPTLECEPICDEEIEFAVATLQPFGARIEAKRRENLQNPLDFLLELHVQAAAPVSRA